MKIFAGVLALAIGILEILFPVPAFVFLIIGGGLLATESRTVARGMDWAELKARRWTRTGERYWRKTPLLARTGLIAAAAGIGAAAMLFAYRFFRD